MAIVLITALVVLIVHTTSRQYIKVSVGELPYAHTAVVLGAALLPNGEMSPVYRDRVDTAIALYKAGKIKTILVSGDNGSKEHNELNPARRYLLLNEVLDEAIFLDHAGFDTYSTMYRARDIFLVEDAIIVTQSFHLPRAVFIARSLGITAYGISADKRVYYISNTVREVFADVKAVLNVLYQRKPKYLGPEIPITEENVATQ